MKVTWLLACVAGPVCAQRGFGWHPHDDSKDEKMVNGLLAAVENLAGRQIPRHKHETSLASEAADWGVADVSSPTERRPAPLSQASDEEKRQRAALAAAKTDVSAAVYVPTVSTASTMEAHAVSSWGTMFAHPRPTSEAEQATPTYVAPVAAALPAMHTSVGISDEETRERAALAAARGEDASGVSMPKPKQVSSSGQSAWLNWKPHSATDDETMVQNVLGAVGGLTASAHSSDAEDDKPLQTLSQVRTSVAAQPFSVPPAEPARSVESHAVSSWGTMFSRHKAAPEAVQATPSYIEPISAALPAVHTQLTSPGQFGAAQPQANNQIEQHMSHESDQVSNLLGMVAGMAKNQKTREALLRRQARVESHNGETSNQLLDDAASLGMGVASSDVTTKKSSRVMSEEEEREHQAVAWKDTGVAQGAMLPATASVHISGTWQPRSMPETPESVEAVEPKAETHWGSGLWDSIGKTAAAFGVSSEVETTTVAPVKRDSLVAAFMRHSKDVETHRVEKQTVQTSLDKDDNLFTAQDAEEAAQEATQEQHEQERRRAAHAAEVHAMYEDASESYLTSNGAPSNSALSRFMGVAPPTKPQQKQHENQFKTGSALDSFSFDDPPAEDSKKLGLTSTHTKVTKLMSRNLASWLGYESNRDQQMQPRQQKKQQQHADSNWYLVDLGLQPEQ